MKTWKDFNLNFPDSFTGEQYSICPVCSPTRKKSGAKCLSANGDKGKFVCHHCGYAGTLESGVSHKGGDIDPAEKKYIRPDYAPGARVLTDSTLQWFKGRGISEPTLTANFIGAESVYFPQTEDEQPAIRFPFFRRGEVINIKSRSKDKMFRLEKNAKRIFYGMDDVTGDTAVIVEGEIDKLSLYEIGIKNALSVPDGAPSPKAKNYESKFEFLDNCADFIGGIKTFILAVDNDEPGQKLEEELARRLGKHRCKKVTWPEGCKDANDVLVKCGSTVLQDVIDQAKDYPVEGIFDTDDIWPDVERLYDQGFVRGRLTGWPKVDECYTVREGELTVVTGIPGHGKSEWLDALMVNLCKSDQWAFAVFSPENQPLERHIAKIVEKYAQRPFYRFISIFNRNKPTEKIDYKRLSKSELAIAKVAMRLHFTFVLPPEDKMTVDGILELCTHVVLKKGIKGVVIDPWNEIDHTRPGTMTETEYVSSSLSKVRRFGRQHGVHVWVVAHPTKLKKLDNGGYPPPTPYDISGSAHWRNKPDNCITVYRDMESNDVDVHIQKVRFKEIGKIGKATLRYDVATGCYQ